jgi:hypothetical protein
MRTSEAEKDTRQRQLRSTLITLAGETPEARQQIELVLESLVKGRLLVSERDTIDLAHEALIQGWKRLAGWCEESRELRRLSQRLESARLAWEKDQQNLSLKPDEKDRNLMMGGLLAEIREQWEALIPYLQDLGKDEPFWQCSNAHEQDRITTLQQALTESKLRELAARAQYFLLVQAQTGLELVIQAIGENQEKLPNQLLSTVQGSLHQALNLVHISNVLEGHERAVRSVAFSSDGKMIVSGSSDKTIRLWDLEGNPIGEPFQGHEDAVRSVAFSPDGKMIVSGSDNRTIRLWDLEGNPIGQLFQGHKSAIWSVAFSPDGKMIVSGGGDKTIRLWRSNWQAWLAVCCKRLAYSLISKNPEQEIMVTDPEAILRSEDVTLTTTQKACAACQKYAWDDESGRKELAQMLRRQSNDLARMGKVELAIAKLQQAVTYDPNLQSELEQRQAVTYDPNLQSELEQLERS